MATYQCVLCDHTLEVENMPRHCPSCYGFKTNLKQIVSRVRAVKPVKVDISCHPTPFNDFNVFLEQRPPEYAGKSDQEYYSTHRKGGLSSVGLTIIAGRTGVGKSIFMMQIAQNWAKSGMTGVMLVTEDRALDRYKKEFSGINGVTILNGYRIGHERLLDEVRALNPKFLVVDSLGETVATGYGDTALQIRSARTGSARQTEVVTDALHEFSQQLGIPVYAIHQVNRQNPTELAGSGKLEYRAQDIFLMENEDTYVGSDTRLKKLWVKKRTNFQDVRTPCYLGFRGGRYEDLRPFLDVGDIAGTMRGLSGVALSASAIQSGLKRLRIGESKVFPGQKLVRTLSSGCVPVKTMPIIASCLDLLRLNLEDLYVQPAFEKDVTVDLSILAACLSMVKGPIGSKAIFIGHVDAHGNIFPVLVDERTSLIEIPFETVLVGNFTRLNHSIANRPNESITHINELPPLLGYLK